MPSPKLLGGNPVTDADPLQVTGGAGIGTVDDPSSANTVIGRLKNLLSRWPASLGQTDAVLSFPVIGAKDAIARLDQTYTRVADTNGYLAGDEVSDNVTGGSATPGQLASAPLVSGGGILIIGGLLMTSQKACVAQFRTHFYNAAPTMSGDNVAFGWKTADKLKWLGYIDWDPFSTEDATNSDGAFAMAGSIRLPMVPAATTLYYRHETKTAFNPDSAQTFTMSLFPAR